jgi:hypothetical protein
VEGTALFEADDPTALRSTTISTSRLAAGRLRLAGSRFRFAGNPTNLAAAGGQKSHSPRRVGRPRKHEISRAGRDRLDCLAKKENRYAWKKLVFLLGTMH